MQQGSLSFYDWYYDGHKNAVVYKLGNIERYTTPKSLDDFGV